MKTEVDMRKLPVMARDHFDSAKLPSLYIAAKKALEECVRIDECKDIVDKHEAIAHYAKQAQDNKLCEYAQRIQLRAVTKMGDLLNSIPNPSKRVKAANDAGISKRIRYRCVHLASSIPRDELNKEIDKSPPPTKTQLDDMSRAFREGKARKWKNTTEYYRAALGCMSGIRKNIETLKPIAPELSKDESRKVAESLTELIEDMDSLLRLAEFGSR